MTGSLFDAWWYWVGLAVWCLLVFAVMAWATRRWM